MDRSPKMTAHTPCPEHNLNLDMTVPRRSEHDEPGPDQERPKPEIARPMPRKAEKPNKASEIQRELTDEEIVAVAGGGSVSEIVVTKDTDMRRSHVPPAITRFRGGKGSPRTLPSLPTRPDEARRRTAGGRTARSDAMAKRSSQGLASLIEERPVEAFEQLNVAARGCPAAQLVLPRGGVPDVGGVRGVLVLVPGPAEARGAWDPAGQACAGFRVPAPGHGAGDRPAARRSR